MKHRKLRIAFSATALAVCVLLLIMRSQSFAKPLNLNIPGHHWATLLSGVCYFDTSFKVSLDGLSRPLPNSIFDNTGAPLASDGKAIAIPILATTLFGGNRRRRGAGPWSRSYSLRTLLLAMTFIAVCVDDYRLEARR